MDTFLKTKRMPDGTEYWRCVRDPNCKVILTTLHGTFKKTKGEYTHPSEDKEIGKRKSIERMKKDVMKDPFKSIPMPHAETRANLLEETQNEDLAVVLIPSYQSIKSTLYRMKKVFSGNPSSRKNIVIKAPWSRTIRDDNFFLFEDGLDDKIIVFRSNN